MAQDTVGELAQVPAPSSLGGDKDMSCVPEMAPSSPHALLGEEGLAVSMGGAPSLAWGRTQGLVLLWGARHCPALSQAVWGGSGAPQCGMESSGAEVNVWVSQGSVCS